MAQAATKHGIEPRTISFKGAIQTLKAFQPVIEFRGGCNSEFRKELYDHLLQCIASHRVANRPDRFEPRKRKRRFKLYDFLDKPRCEAKIDMLKGVKEKISAIRVKLRTHKADAVSCLGPSTYLTLKPASLDLAPVSQSER